MWPISASGQCWSQSCINGRVVPGKGSGVKSVPKQIWGFILCGDRTGADTHAITLLLHLYKQVCCFPACCRTMSIKYRCIFPHNPSLAFFLLLSLWQGIIFPCFDLSDCCMPAKGIVFNINNQLEDECWPKVINHHRIIGGYTLILFFASVPHKHWKPDPHLQ